MTSRDTPCIHIVEVRLPRDHIEIWNLQPPPPAFCPSLAPKPQQQRARDEQQRDGCRFRRSPAIFRFAVSSRCQSHDTKAGGVHAGGEQRGGTRPRDHPMIALAPGGSAHIQPVNQNLAAVRPQQAGHHRQGRGLPAPFGPTSPAKEPAAISRSIPATASFAPKLLRSPRTEMAGSPISASLTTPAGAVGITTNSTQHPAADAPCRIYDKVALSWTCSVSTPVGHRPARPGRLAGFRAERRYLEDIWTGSRSSRSSARDGCQGVIGLQPRRCGG